VSTLALPSSAGCVRAWRDKPYREALALRDGRHVTLRPAHHSDAPALRQFFFGSLSPRARLLRFHGAINQLPDGALRAMTTQIPRRHVALVALTPTDDGLQHLLAEARYVVEDGGEAEFAIAVADAWQGQGLGRALVQRLAAHARAEGIPALHGAVVPGNEPMLRLMDSLGAQLHGHAPEVKVRLAL
jgi:RimJ/RimL family protein N-acetyltransferase